MKKCICLFFALFFAVSTVSYAQATDTPQLQGIGESSLSFEWMPPQDHGSIISNWEYYDCWHSGQPIYLPVQGTHPFRQPWKEVLEHVGIRELTDYELVMSLDCIIRSFDDLSGATTEELALGITNYAVMGMLGSSPDELMGSTIVFNEFFLVLEKEIPEVSWGKIVEMKQRAVEYHKDGAFIAGLKQYFRDGLNLLEILSDDQTLSVTRREDLCTFLFTRVYEILKDIKKEDEAAISGEYLRLDLLREHFTAIAGEHRAFRDNPQRWKGHLLQSYQERRAFSVEQSDPNYGHQDSELLDMLCFLLHGCIVGWVYTFLRSNLQTS